MKCLLFVFNVYLQSVFREMMYIYNAYLLMYLMFLFDCGGFVLGINIFDSRIYTTQLKMSVTADCLLFIWVFNQIPQKINSSIFSPLFNFSSWTLKVR